MAGVPRARVTTTPWRWFVDRPLGAKIGACLALLALVVALNILWQGWKVINTSIQGLMDRAAPLEDHVRIRDIISANSKGALEVHDLKTRIAGRATFIEFHLVVDASMTVGDSHVICDRIEGALKAEIPSVRIIIHVEPDDEAKLPAGSSAVPFA